jgi:hypothetical protein
LWHTTGPRWRNGIPSHQQLVHKRHRSGSSSTNVTEAAHADTRAEACLYGVLLQQFGVVRPQAYAGASSRHGGAESLLFVGQFDSRHTLTRIGGYGLVTSASHTTVSLIPCGRGPATAHQHTSGAPHTPRGARVTLDGGGARRRPLAGERRSSAARSKPAAWAHMAEGSPAGVAGSSSLPCARGAAVLRAASQQHGPTWPRGARQGWRAAAACLAHAVRGRAHARCVGGRRWPLVRQGLAAPRRPQRAHTPP